MLNQWSRILVSNQYKHTLWSEKYGLKIGHDDDGYHPISVSFVLLLLYYEYILVSGSNTFTVISTNMQYLL